MSVTSSLRGFFGCDDRLLRRAALRSASSCRRRAGRGRGSCRPGESSIARTRAAIAGHIARSKPPSAFCKIGVGVRRARAVDRDGQRLDAGAIRARGRSRGPRAAAERTSLPLAPSALRSRTPRTSAGPDLRQSVDRLDAFLHPAARSAATPMRLPRPWSAASAALGSLRLSMATLMPNSSASLSRLAAAAASAGVTMSGMLTALANSNTLRCVASSPRLSTR